MNRRGLAATKTPGRANAGRVRLNTLAVALFCLSLPVFADSFEITDSQGNTLNVEVLGTGGSPRLLWPNTLEEGPPGVARTKQRLLDAGFELWLADPLEARFLPHTSENIRTLPGTTVAAMIGATAAHPPKPTLLLAHGRMALPALRGVRLWQQTRADAGRLDGARLDGLALLYPNLFGPTPAAGDEPSFDPIVAASNWPMLIVQPERGALRWALPQVLAATWRNAAQAYAQLIPDVRDWYLFHEPGKDPLEDAAAARLPYLLEQAAHLLGDAPRPQAPGPAARRFAARGEPITGLRERPGLKPAPDFALRDAHGRNHSLDDYLGGVTLVNFWASWCPPCVEEIPSMNRLAARYDSNVFRIVSINFQESKPTIRAFMRQVDVDFPVLVDADGSVSRDWHVLAFPSSFILDAQGRIRWSVNSAIAWDEPAVFELIERLIAEDA